MSNLTNFKDYVGVVLQANGLGVLATEGDGQPHASLVAITPMDDVEHLIFATYRNTGKYKNLINNGKVAILFQKRSEISLSQPDVTVLTAFGYAREVDRTAADAARQAHLLRHPELESFLLSADCTLFLVHVNAYQLVRGIDDIHWWNIAD